MQDGILTNHLKPKLPLKQTTYKQNRQRSGVIKIEPSSSHDHAVTYVLDRGQSIHWPQV